MANLGENFNAADLPESQSFEPVPAGWYNVTIAGAELRDTKAGTGQYIAIRYDITGPEYEGRVIWGNLNIRNPNPKAEEIGRQQLGGLMRSIGLNKVSDTDELVGGHCQIKVNIKRDAEFGDKNDVKDFRALDGGGTMPAAKTAPAAESKAAPPWAKK